ncbi:MAG: endo-1,4-beta-xylanase, partial [Armatimonadota bacterium]
TNTSTLQNNAAVTTTLTATANILSAQAGPAAVELQVTDTLDQPVGTVRRELPLKPGVTASSFSVPVPGPGFYRLRLTVKQGGQSARATARRAVCLSSPAKDASAFGINHAYGFDAPMRLAKSLGITWVRDWSLKWEHVEPRAGEFTWQAVDEQLSRALRLGMKVLCMFPFPSAEWSSSAPAELKTAGYPGNRIRQAYAPRDPAAMARYMAACVARYKDRIHTWEIFNESLYTDYSLPRKGGYKPEDYLPLLDAASAACKQADPSCQVMGGYSAPPGSLDLYGPLFKGGGLGESDLISLHIYPGDAPEHLQPDLDGLNAAMDASGGRKPTWMTEFAYYADDDPDPVKVSWPGLVESELVQASWNTRAMVIMLANGVQKVFYHIWPATLNRNVGTEIFFEFAGAPHKIAPAQAALNYFLGPTPKLAAKDAGHTSEDLYCYVFQAPPHVGQLKPSPPGESWVAVVWSSYETLSLPVGPGWRCYDLCGKPLTGAPVAVGPQPIYLCASGASADALAKAIA